MRNIYGNKAKHFSIFERHLQWIRKILCDIKSTGAIQMFSNMCVITYAGKPRLQPGDIPPIPYVPSTALRK